MICFRIMRVMGSQTSGRYVWLAVIGLAALLQLGVVALLAMVGIWVPGAGPATAATVDLSISAEIPPLVERPLEFGDDHGGQQTFDSGAFDRMQAADWLERLVVERQSMAADDWALAAESFEGLDGLIPDHLADGLASLDFGADISFSFLGLNEAAERVVIAFDISLSVVNDMRQAGQSIERVRDETDRLLDDLSALVQFGLVQFARNHCWFRNELQPATAAVRLQAREWLQREFRTDGRAGYNWQRGQPYNGIQAVLAEVFAHQPEVIIIVSNGRFFRSPGNQPVPWDELADDLRRLQRQLHSPARIHFIGYGVRDDIRPRLRELLRPWRGKLVENTDDRDEGR